jgi:hypothetical protein
VLFGCFGITAAKQDPADAINRRRAFADWTRHRVDRPHARRERQGEWRRLSGEPERAETVADAGMAVPEAMGTAETISFQPTSDGKATIAGDFVLTANEVNPVLRFLRDNDIEVTALHNHMLDAPRLFFMHFWANDDVTKLAAGLRAALDRMALARQ